MFVIYVFFSFLNLCLTMLYRMFSDMATQKKHTINFLMEGKKRKLTGVTKYTTCDDIVRMVSQRTTERKLHEVSQLGVYERVDGIERLLSRKDSLLKILRSWGSDVNKIDIVVKRVSDVKSKMAKISKQKQKLGLMRSGIFDAEQDPNEAFIDMGNSRTSNPKCSVVHSECNRDNDVCRSHKGGCSALKRQNNIDTKQTVFQRFYRVLKRKVGKTNAVEKRKRNICTPKINIKTFPRNKKSTTSLKNNVFQGQAQDFIDKFYDLDEAFIDEEEGLDMETDADSVLNECILVEDTENIRNGAWHDNRPNVEYEMIGGLKKPIGQAHSFKCKEEINDNTFRKLDEIKHMFDSNMTRCKSNDEFMESFMRSKLYESESDGDL